MGPKGKIRILFTFLMLPAVLGAGAMSFVFRLHCKDFRDLTGLPEYFFLTTLVLEMLQWLNAGVALLCLLLFFIRSDDCPVAVGYQSTLICIAIGCTCWSFGEDARRYKSLTGTKLMFQTYVDWTDHGFLGGAPDLKEQRRYDVERLKFLDKIQAKHKCCGLVDYKSYNSETTQKWLHNDLTNSCFTAIDEPIPNYCKPIFKDDREIPDSCCKVRGCNTTDVFYVGYNTSLINTKGCRKIMREPFDKCVPILPFVLSLAFFLSVYLPLIAYAHARQVQGTSFWTKFCCYCLWTTETKHRGSIDEFSRMVLALSKRNLTKSHSRMSQKTII